MRALLAPLFLLAVSAQDKDLYAEPPTTLKGCTCKGECTTSLAFECSAQPFCSVAGSDCAHGVAEWSLSYGYYDYCLFGAYKPYESLKASQKLDMLLERVRRDKTPDSYPFSALIFPGVVGESVMVSFDAQADVFPQKRTKYIHSVGVVAPIEFLSAGNHSYTGLFRTGAAHGLVRVSSAKYPTESIIPPGPGFTPGIAVKLLRDGRPSSNFVAMPSLDGQTCADRNFFAHPFTNHVPATKDFGLKLIAAKFWQASYCPQMVGISDLAAEAEASGAGNTSDVAPHFPWELFLRPPPTENVDCPCNDYSKCMGNLESLKPGSTLFDVLAAESPGAKEQLIGRMVLTGQFATSKFGDEDLFFRHQRMEEDFARKPEWLEQIDKKTYCGMDCATGAAPAVEKGCSSPFHGDYGSQLNTDMTALYM